MTNWVKPQSSSGDYHPWLDSYKGSPNWNVWQQTVHEVSTLVLRPKGFILVIPSLQASAFVFYNSTEGKAINAWWLSNTPKTKEEIKDKKAYRGVIKIQVDETVKNCFILGFEDPKEEKAYYRHITDTVGIEMYQKLES